MMPFFRKAKRYNKRGGRGRMGNNATRRMPARGTSFQARDSQWLGFFGETEALVPGAGNGGFAIRIDPTGSTGFVQRFNQAWQSWRMVAWNVEVSIVAKATSDSQNFPNTVNPVAAFELSNLSTSSGLPVPNEVEVFAELPNVKYMSVFPGSPHCRKRFAWRTTDINYLPFQTFDTTITALSQTGIWGFIDMGRYQEELQVQVYGKILVEFKDARFWKPAAVEIQEPRNMDDDDEDPRDRWINYELPRSINERLAFLEQTINSDKNKK
jgi:hypothetical protein